jgi:hypothetical protein
MSASVQATGGLVTPDGQNFGAVAARTRLVIARLFPGLAHVDRLDMYDRRDCIEEGERILAGLGKNGLREIVGCQRPRGDDDAGPRGGRPAINLTAFDGNQRMLLKRRRHVSGEGVAVDGKSRARRHAMTIAHADDETRGPAHFLVQQPDGIVLPVIRPK